MRMMLRLRLLKFFPGNPQVLENHSCLPAGKQQRICVFASYSKLSKVEDYVFFNLSQLCASGFDIVFVTTAQQLRHEDLKQLEKLCVRVIRRKNVGYDFGSWKAGLFYSGVDVRGYNQLLLTNDSYYGPVYSWKEALAKAKTDLYGITDSYGIHYHLMSYFVLYNSKALQSAEFDRLWRDVRMIPTILKTLVIYAYEVEMSRNFQKKGFSIGAYCPERALFDKLPEHEALFTRTIIVHRFWRELIEWMHCPILKTDVFWRVLNSDDKPAWVKVLQKAGYDFRLIERHQKQKSG